MEKIKQGEEITFSYYPNKLETITEMRRILREKCDFDCRCEACGLPEQEAQKQDQIIERYKQVERQREDLANRTSVAAQDPQAVLTHLRRREECLKELCKLGKEIKTWCMFLHLKAVTEAYTTSVTGAMIASARVNWKTTEIVWTRKAMLYVDMALTMAKTMFGEDHWQTEKLSAYYEDLDVKFRKLLRE